MMLEPGTDIGAYRIEGLLGRGGMGIVYEATQHSLGRKVALKLLAADLSFDESFRRRFRREGRLQAGLDHAHIVPIYEAGELEDHGLFIAMRLVRGSTLKELVKSGELDGERTLRLLRPVADALDSAHEADLVHRDIKPQNILVGRRDHAYLADFGLTRAPGDTAFTKTGQFVGTLDYIAPEQIRGEQPGPASDLYSFAAVAYECFTGTVPFPQAHRGRGPVRAHVGSAAAGVGAAGHAATGGRRRARRRAGEAPVRPAGHAARLRRGARGGAGRGRARRAPRAARAAGRAAHGAAHARDDRGRRRQHGRAPAAAGRARRRPEASRPPPGSRPARSPRP